MSNVIRALAVAGALLAGGLLPGATRAVAAASDAGVRDCGPITSVGCCADEVLFWCTPVGLRARSCADRPLCGWRERGIYACNTAGSADPSGQSAMGCDFGDAGAAPVDAGRSVEAGAGGCGEVTAEGCCAGEVLRYCEGAQLRQVSCAANVHCGWRGVAQHYDCGSDGKADPSGRFVRDCSGPPADAGPAAPDLALVDLGADLAPRTDASPRVGDGGCGCDGAGGRPSTLAALLLLLLAAFARSVISSRD